MIECYAKYLLNLTCCTYNFHFTVKYECEKIIKLSNRIPKDRYLQNFYENELESIL